MKQTILYTTLFAAVLILNSCSTSPVCVTSSVTPMDGKVITENLGKTDGEDTAYSPLGLFMIGRPDLDLAIKSALQKKGGDTLINVNCYESYIWLLLFSSTTVRVEGDAIKFTVNEVETKEKKKDKKK